ncbi:hypothetical protein [Moraxella boevrei]|uniref:hypothetical protein n=1 Tax=Faucicola boevrei TaxID=346665 RepID=UPI003734C734
MQSYDQVTNFIHAKIAKLTLNQQLYFVKHLIYQFSKNLANNWLDSELDSEKAHYQTIFNQINDNLWQADVIDDALAKLDDIMWAMGENYPHTTSDEILLIMEMLDYWLALSKLEQKDDNSNQLTFSTSLCLLTHFDEKSETRLGETTTYEDWLAYPETEQSFNIIKVALAKTAE